MRRLRLQLDSKGISENHHTMEKTFRSIAFLFVVCVRISIFRLVKVTKIVVLYPFGGSSWKERIVQVYGKKL